MWTIGRFEWRITLRQKTSYLFLILWSVVLFLIFMLFHSSPGVTSYTNITGAAVNLLLYLVPLFMMIHGSFAVATDMESGQWKLLATYPLSSFSYLSGKLVGQVMAQTIILTLSFSVSFTLALFFQIGITLPWFLAMYMFAVLLQLFFLILGIAIGSMTKGKWQALTMSVATWFLFIMIWPTALISILQLVPYPWIAPILQVSLWVNPAELLRIVFVILMGGGSVFGQTYDNLLLFWKKDIAIIILAFYYLFFTAVLLFVASLRMERRKSS